MFKRPISTFLLGFAFCLLAVPAFGQTPPGGYGPGQGGSSSTSTGGFGVSNTGYTKNLVDVTATSFNTPLANFCTNTNVSVTTGSNQVTCANYTFTAADIGKIAWVSCCGGFGGTAKLNSTEYIVQGVINSVVSAHVAAICTTTGACTPVNASAQANCQSNALGCQLYFGFDGTTQLQSAITAAYGTVGPCPTLLIPGWVIITQPGIGNTTPTCQYTIGNLGDRGMVIAGVGRNNSGIIVSPSATKGSYAATCTGLGTVPSCLFGIQGKTIRFMGISGGGEAVTGTHSGFAIITASTDDNFLDVGIEDWGASDLAAAGFIGLQMEGPGAYIENPIVDGAGNIGIKAQNAGTGPFNSLIGCFSGDSGVATIGGTQASSLAVAAGAQLFTLGCYWGQAPTPGASVIVVDTGGFWDSTNDSLLAGGGGNNTGLFVNGTARVTNMKFANASIGGAFISATGTLISSNSRWQGSTTSITGAAGGKFVDLGGNTFTGLTSVISWLGAGNGDTFRATCTGVGTAASTLGLYGTGSNVTATTCTSATIGAGQVMKNSGNLIRLSVSATAAGTNASSGVVTVLKNGVSQTLTCTIGTGTSCNDTHPIAYVPGDLISIQFTTQAADTLAGVTAQVVAN